jgi:hypothetical protein
VESREGLTLSTCASCDPPDPGTELRGLLSRESRDLAGAPEMAGRGTEPITFCITRAVCLFRAFRALRLGHRAENPVAMRRMTWVPWARSSGG